MGSNAEPLKVKFAKAWEDDGNLMHKNILQFRYHSQPVSFIVAIYL
jgi:hypothetical protein